MSPIFINWIKSLIKSPQPQSVGRGFEFLTESTWPTVVYAIGDVHGCYDLLLDAERAILQDSAAVGGDKLIILLGDVVDRGLKSAQIIDHLIAAPPKGFRRICLAGNHEVMMTQFLVKPSLKSNWLKFGGLETLNSYGITQRQLFANNSYGGDRLKQLIKSCVPDEHLEFLQLLPIGLRLPGLTFVHAGLRADALTLMRFGASSFDLRLEALHELAVRDRCIIVHGHHAQNSIELTNSCLNLDTGAYATGRLSFARFTNGSTYTYFEARNTLR